MKKILACFLLVVLALFTASQIWAQSGLVNGKTEQERQWERQRERAQRRQDSETARQAREEGWPTQPLGFLPPPPPPPAWMKDQKMTPQEADEYRALMKRVARDNQEQLKTPLK